MLADVQAAIDGQRVELAHEGLELKLGSHTEGPIVV
jgi:hypothetical protein